jgi:hypothetical protein
MFGFVAALSVMLITQAEPIDDLALPPEQQKKWEEFYRDEAASYLISLDEKTPKELKFRPEPVLLWSNPIRGNDTRGSVFVWTYEGRAEVIGTVFSYRAGANHRQVKHSFHSLSLSPLIAERNMQDAWSIRVQGINPKKIPEAPVPAKTRALRLSQMRDLAREFSATTTLNDVRQELRLLPQPLFRNEEGSNEVLDGAVFTFVTGTDPELMLVIEARGKDDKCAWHFGAGRFTDLALELTRNQTVLWTYEEGLVDNEKTPYLSRKIELRSKHFPAP